MFADLIRRFKIQNPDIFITFMETAPPYSQIYMQGKLIGPKLATLIYLNM